MVTGEAEFFLSRLMSIRTDSYGQRIGMKFLRPEEKFAKGCIISLSTTRKYYKENTLPGIEYTEWKSYFIEDALSVCI